MAKQGIEEFHGNSLENITIVPDDIMVTCSDLWPPRKFYVFDFVKKIQIWNWGEIGILKIDSYEVTVPCSGD